MPPNIITQQAKIRPIWSPCRQSKKICIKTSQSGFKNISSDLHVLTAMYVGNVYLLAATAKPFIHPFNQKAVQIFLKGNKN
jgi:hypothetical protein